MAKTLQSKLDCNNCTFMKLCFLEVTRKHFKWNLLSHSFSFDSRMWQDATSTFHHSSNLRGFYKCWLPRSALIYWQPPQPALQNILFHWFDFPPQASHSSLLLRSLANLRSSSCFQAYRRRAARRPGAGTKETEGREGEKDCKRIKGVSANLRK